MVQRLCGKLWKRKGLQINAAHLLFPITLRFETRCSPKTCLEIMSPSANEAFCEYQHRKDSSGTDFGIHLNLNKSLRLIIYLIILDDYLPDLDLDQLAAVCKTVQENIQKDVTILANSTDGPGQEVLSANKAFLMAHSPVLKALFEGNIAESNKYTIKMEFSVDCVQAMLDYMFTLSFWPAIKSSRLAVKLFQAAHHYQIQHLEDKLVEMLLERRNSWFEADAAFELFQTASRIELHSSAELKKKAVEILKSKGNLRESAELAKLYDEDRDTALELTSVALAN
ncbi:BTB/POZ domain-containing protein [Orchesella cincta]|uniref:BTB/POZ domain-containing protein n=1 Tax=Orchesella cincta TaxID=48709 RepID=A0A1D2M0W8_ORCCI|nr:BTB/POZ domain-containing protein [Orchesella cincta]